MFRQCLYASAERNNLPHPPFRHEKSVTLNRHVMLCKLGENIVTNHLQKSLAINQRRLLRKRNLTRVPDGRFG